MVEHQTFVRFKTITDSQSHYGVIQNDTVRVLTAAPWSNGTESDKINKLSEITLLPPVTPSKIVCVGLNYHAHVDASHSAQRAPDLPMLFLKPPSAVIGHDEHIIHPKKSERVDFEAELGVVIGKQAKNVSIDESDDFIFGFTCVNDVTARDLQKKDGQWGRAKGFDTFCPVGPSIVSGIDYSSLKVEGWLNGNIKQDGSTANMIFKLPYLISYISSIMTLNPGDLISTGTPSGIEPMKPGDVVEVKVENVGTLRNQVTGE